MKENILNKYKEMYGKSAEHYLESGGRFELLGNHTDHNHGKTLASTCSLIIESAFAKEDNNIVRSCAPRGPRGRRPRRRRDGRSCGDN